ncbi:phosphatidic acid phosphatase type 2/haloperoxidase [Paraphysoderma sedebokerense]|nr:phosphatidic acid phosphatase type 2/haloperoxidase [Paraphysoderma sedebokerense]
MKALNSLTKVIIIDFLVVIVLAAAAYLVDRIPPFERKFFTDDDTIRYPYKDKDTVPESMLILYAGIIPLISVILISIFIKKGNYLKEMPIAVNALLLACVSTILLTHIIKISAGRLRPDFLARCKPQQIESSSEATCTGDPAVIIEGRKSFPSGHASFSFAGLSFLAFYLAGALKAYVDVRRHSWKVAVTMLPIFGAFLIAISRTTDYRHHYQDVFVGGLIGLIFAFGTYRFFYPTLLCNECKVPYRISEIEEVLPSSIPLISSGNDSRDDRRGSESVGLQAVVTDRRDV